MESDILLAPTLRARWSKSLSLSSLVGEFPKPPAECWRTSVRTPQDCGGYGIQPSPSYIWKQKRRRLIYPGVFDRIRKAGNR